MTPGRDAIDESALLRNCRDGVPGAFARLYGIHKDRAYSLAVHMLGRADLAEDVTQKAFLRVHRSLATFRGESRFATWLHRVVVNLCLDERRKETDPRTVQLDETTLARLVAPEESDRDTLAGDRAATLHAALGRLSEETRDAIVMKYLAGLTYDEIAEAQGCTKGTVGSRIHRGLLSLRGILERQERHV